MAFVKFSVATVQPLGSDEEMPKWVEGVLLGQPIEDSGTPVLEGEQEAKSCCSIPVTTVEE